MIYFEGTYTDTYSGVKDLTPRYNYNQLMYRLDLSDPRLSLPAPVYCLSPPGSLAFDSAGSLAMRGEIDATGKWASAQSVPFYAVPPSLKADGLIPLYRTATGSDAFLTDALPTPGAKPLFYALPAVQSLGGKPNPNIIPLYEFTAPGARQRWYAPNADGLPGGVVRGPQPLCRVWRNPSSVLALDAGRKKSRHKRLGFDGLAVAHECHRAVMVGAKRLDAMRGEAGQRGRGGMAEMVVQAAGNGGEMGMNAGEERITRRIGSSVMSGFENVGGEIGAGGQHGGFGLDLGVARQQKVDAAIGQAQHDRIIVNRSVIGVDSIGRSRWGRIKNLGGHAIA